MGEHTSFLKQRMIDGLTGTTRKGRRTLEESKDIVRARSRGWCEIGVSFICEGRAGEFHHRLMRSQGGPDTPDNLAHACAACHRHVHANPSWAYRLGWLLRKAC